MIPIDVSTKEMKSRRIQNNQLSCDVCSNHFSCKSLLKRHMQQHSQLRKFDCDVPGCKYSAKVSYILKNHKERVHPSILYTCLWCGKNIKSHIIYKLHMAKHNTQTPGVFKCLHPKCKKLFENGDDLQNHIKEAHEKAKKFQCNECNKFFASKANVIQHIQHHWDQRPFQCDKPGCSYSAKRPYHLQRHRDQVHSFSVNRSTCIYCGKMIKDSVSFKKHVEKHKTNTAGVFKCHRINCKELFSVPLDLKTHVEQHKLHSCDIACCLFKSEQKINLHLHRRTVHSIFLHNCQLCSKGFDHSRDLKQHMQFHETVEPGVIKCSKNNCKQTLTSRVDLKMHLDNHKTLFAHQKCLKLTTKKFECHLCGRIFKSSRSKFQVHILKHETKTPGGIKCSKNNCKQTFTSVAHFKKHLDDHKSLTLQQNASKLDANEFECQLCGKIIKSHLTNFERHVVKHETGTPGVIKCIFGGCKQTFNSATDLKQHCLEHWDVSLRPFACDFPQCNFAFKINSDLLRHKRHVHSSNLYTCELCGKQFKHLSYVSLHFKRCHIYPQNVEISKSTL
jgi:KRAB domain-containing zinc finger protein